jgi:hypothetical protein
MSGCIQTDNLGDQRESDMFRFDVLGILDRDGAGC